MNDKLYFIEQTHEGGWSKRNLPPMIFAGEAWKLVPCLAMDSNPETFNFVINLLNDSGYRAGMEQAQ